MRTNAIRIECHVRQPVDAPPPPGLDGRDRRTGSSRVAVIGPPGLAMEVARLRPEAIIDLHVADWSLVDAARTAVATAGLADRVHVHHWHASLQIDASAYDVVLRAPDEVGARPPGLET